MTAAKLEEKTEVTDEDKGEIPKIQGRVDAFVEWFNEHRPHGAHGIRTPAEAEVGSRLITPVRYDLARGMSGAIDWDRAAATFAAMRQEAESALIAAGCAPGRCSRRPTN